jgi:D-inositol-3-phosphate glycosyltransferase
LSLSLSKFYVLFFGQIKKTKGLDILIKAMSQDLPGDIELIIAGKPWHDDFKTYEQQIKHLGIENRVKLKIGFIEDVEKELLLSAVNILVLPYRQIFQSGVALMAMSRNVPIIASDLEPFVEITQQGRLGRLFKSEDHESLKNQILKAYHNPEETSLISKSAFDFVSENYDWNDIASLYVELFQDQDI